jgi:uncharacterized protein
VKRTGRGYSRTVSGVVGIADRSWLNPKVEMRATPNSGRGLFALAQIDAGETVIVWGGDYRDAAGAAQARGEGKGTMQWDDDVFSIETGDDDPAYSINHACDGNVWMMDAVTLAARRRIAAGEQVRADYALWEADEDYVSAWDCACESPLCRRRITGRDWRLPDVQERYAGHFSPLINKRIDAMRGP